MCATDACLNGTLLTQRVFQSSFNILEPFRKERISYSQKSQKILLTSNDEISID